MPAIVTHDVFGQDLYREFYEFIGDSRDEFEAFLLGNQGPDPLFYGIANPRLRKFTSLASTMHSKSPNELFFALKRSFSILEEESEKIGRAYALGFLCHYLLDSHMHPFVYAKEYELCDAGIEDLSREDGNEVHALIESELDEMVLFTRLDTTVADFNPSKKILRASDEVLTIVSKMYAYMATVVYGEFVPKNMFSTSVKLMRTAMSAFHSKTGMKRFLIGKAEELFRSYSFFKSMSPRSIELAESSFENREHKTWTNPFTGEESRESFWEIYETAQEKARKDFFVLDGQDFSLEKAAIITEDFDFSGRPTFAILTVEEKASS